MAEFGNSGTYSKSYFDECFSKFGVYEDSEYAGGVSSFEYGEKRKSIVQQVNKSVGELLLKERGTTTSEYATSTTYSSTSGSLPTLLPIWVSPDIISLSQKETPLYEMLPKIAVRGKFYDWNTATFASTNASFKPEDAPFAEYDDTYTRNTVQMKYAYAIGRVTGPMQIHAQGYIDMKRQEILMKTRALLQKIENEIVNGSISTDANGFNGLGASISTNTTSLGAALSISDIRTSIRYCKQGGTTYSATLGGGNPNLIVCDLATFDDIKALLQAYLRYNGPMVSIAWGFQTIEFEGIPVIASKFMTTTSGSKALYVLDINVVKMGIALDLTMEDLAKTNDSDKFYIKWYGALLVLVETWCAEITSIS